MGYSIPQRLLREKQRDDFKGSMVWFSDTVICIVQQMLDSIFHFFEISTLWIC
jgi:hypothetical protein